MNEQCRGKAPIKVVTDAWQTLIKLSGIDTYSYIFAEWKRNEYVATGSAVARMYICKQILKDWRGSLSHSCSGVSAASGIQQNEPRSYK